MVKIGPVDHEIIVFKFKKKIKKLTQAKYIAWSAKNKKTPVCDCITQRLLDLCNTIARHIVARSYETVRYNYNIVTLFLS